MLFLLFKGRHCKVVFSSKQSAIKALLFYREEYPQEEWSLKVAEEI